MIIVPLIVACALFMQIFDGSVISTALPAMAESLKTDPLQTVGRLWRAKR